MNQPFFLVSDIVESNGKTIRENNLEKQHNIPVGTLVEAKFTDWFGDGACSRVHARLWVVKHIRDCDGTPLYCLAETPLDKQDKMKNEQLQKMLYGWKTGMPEDALTVVPVTEALKRGEGQLNWEDEE